MINVLIIEDEHAIRRFLRTALEADGMRVFEADTLQRGLIEAATRKPDVVILDLGLPDGDGNEFYSRRAPVESDANYRAVGPY
ncbi:KDP operon transcriptional regulatory protein KdpE [Raoultella planticola]|uniref:KDP operon transcriptional regulatory protein KdpE n=1 Tax=Raoultella planticola TaxID=575 RepID=A0A485AVB6_RAOPL|nr:KDP operon transcriptional regulatory protein KdpE [Raoultella planticola]